jgi:hypothetical protein
MAESSQRDFIRRANMVSQTAEQRRSLLFGQYGERRVSVKSKLRRSLDLQAGPNWGNDRKLQ